MDTIACKRITSEILPAVRASIAEVMHKKYSYSESDIAKSLGIVQVAVSKYLNSNYSSKTKRVKDYIIKNRLNEDILNSIVSKRSEKDTNAMIYALCMKLASNLNF
jgi:predicted transcriptional regulator